MSDEPTVKHRKSPCANCPYRKDAPKKLWHREEFENLLRQDARPESGKLFSCHKEGA